MPTAITRLLRHVIALLLVAGVFAAGAYFAHPHRPAFQPTRPLEIALDQIPAPEAALWIDARSSAAYATAHIPGAISLHEDAWESSLAAFVEAWKPGQKIIVYCDSAKCGASEAVARRLMREFDVSNIHVLKGGWETWQHPR